MPSVSALRRSWTLLGLVGLLAGPLTSAFAQRGGDDGDFQILQARYGTATHNIDVTARLKDLARQDRVFRAGNEVLGGDPHPGEKKTLRIYTRDREGRHRTFEYAEGQTVDGNQFTGWSGGNWGHGGWNGGWGDKTDDGDWEILEARYGTAARNIDVTQRLRELARQDRRFRMGNATFGTDPHPGEVKTLRIYARARDGQKRTFEFREDSWVDGNQFTGWSGGNWGGGGWGGGWGDDKHPGSVGPGRSQLAIVSASYGDRERQRDVTERLRARVRGDRIDVRVDNELAGGDPAPDTVKTLWVVYTVGGGREQRTRVTESERLRLP